MYTKRFVHAQATSREISSGILFVYARVFSKHLSFGSRTIESFSELIKLKSKPEHRSRLSSMQRLLCEAAKHALLSFRSVAETIFSVGREGGLDLVSNRRYFGAVTCLPFLVFYMENFWADKVET